MILRLSAYVILACLAAVAQEAKSLAGLRNFYVMIPEPPKSIEEQLFPDVNELRTQVELKLRLAGVAIVPAEPAGSSKPYLELVVSAVKSDVTYAVCISLLLNQDIVLARNGVRISSVTTWRDGYVLALGIARVKSSIFEQTLLLVDSFINDFLSANPRSAAR